MQVDHEQRISEVTRRSVFDRLELEALPWAGCLEEPEFLSRLYDLTQMRSTDCRFQNAYGDIVKHRINNFDWDDYWVFDDPRFTLLRCPDDEFLRFLCEMIHPVVQRNKDVISKFLDIFNSCLACDGFQIVEATHISGRPVYAGRECVAGSPALSGVREIGVRISAAYLSQQITRMQTAIHSDPELAIGTAKELIETCCKTILRERAQQLDDGWEIPRLLNETLNGLDLAPGTFPKAQAITASIRRTLGHLAQLAQGAAELRNLFGTGHGKDAATPPPLPHHARLAVGAASTLAVFLFEQHQLGRRPDE
jgi:hypothetical protein